MCCKHIFFILRKFRMHSLFEWVLFCCGCFCLHNNHRDAYNDSHSSAIHSDAYPCTRKPDDITNISEVCGWSILYDRICTVHGVSCW